MSLFDEIVAVDWSAASVPRVGADSIWVARMDVVEGRVDLVNHATRREAEEALVALLVAAAGRRVLVGVDVPFGYPAGFAACVAPLAPADGRARPDCRPDCRPDWWPDWWTVWSVLRDLVVDDRRNRNNRYEVAARLNATVGPGAGPFWGCPPAHVTETLAARKVAGFPVAGPARALAELRRCEVACRVAGRRPLSVWQTAYAGSVGGQALLAIPVLARLVDHPDLRGRSELRGRVEVWPFTTGLVADPTGGRPDAVVLAEVWPSWFDVDRAVHPVKDAAQVLAVCRRLAERDAAGALAGWFALDPARIDGADTAPEIHTAPRVVTAPEIVAEEGWILGVP